MISELDIHIPFCTRRCSYFSLPTQACHDEPAMDAYAEARGLQLRRAAKAGLLGGVRPL